MLEGDICDKKTKKSSLGEAKGLGWWWRNQVCHVCPFKDMGH
jgi:hypothetical protein